MPSAAPVPTANRQVSVIVFDLAGTLQFLGSVAMSVAIQNHTTLFWKEYRDSKVLNAIYTVFAWKGQPGWVEISQDWEKIHATRNQLWERYMLAFLKKASAGPAEACTYLQRMEDVKAGAIEGVQWVFSEAQKINSEVIGETQTAIKRLAVIKCTAAVSIAVMSGGLAVVGSSIAVQAGTVALGYKVTAVVVKSLDEGKSAKVVAIDMGKGVGKEIGEDKLAQPGLEYALRWLVTRPAAIEAAKKLGLFASINGAVNTYAEQLARAKAESLKRKLAARIADRNARAAGLAGGAVSRGVPVLFAVKDIVEAIDEYNEDTGGL